MEPENRSELKALGMVRFALVWSALYTEKRPVRRFLARPVVQCETTELLFVLFDREGNRFRKRPHLDLLTGYKA